MSKLNLYKVSWKDKEQMSKWKMTLASKEEISQFDQNLINTKGAYMFLSSDEISNHMLVVALNHTEARKLSKEGQLDYEETENIISNELHGNRDYYLDKD